MRANNGTFEVLLGADAAGGIVSTMTNHDLQLRAGGNDTKVVIKADGRLGVGIATPSNHFHVVGNLGIRQNRLYVSGGDGGLDNWSSISYNAHHNDANNAWTFPDATRKAVALEMDDSNGPARFQVWTTRSAAPTSWVQRFAINGETGDILMARGRRHGRHRWQHPEPHVERHSGAQQPPGQPGAERDVHERRRRGHRLRLRVRIRPAVRPDRG